MKNSLNKNKHLLQIVISLLIATGIFGGLLYYGSRQVELPLNYHSSFFKYSKYLKMDKDDVNKIEVFIDELKGDKYNHYLTIHNRSDKFYCGDIKLFNNNKVIYQNRIINMKPKDVLMIPLYLEAKSDDYKLTNNSFYVFNYPKPEAKGYESKDVNDDKSYAYRNLVLETLRMDVIEDYAKYYYVLDILAGERSNDIFIYDPNNVNYIKKDNAMYPDLSDAIYGIYIDQDNEVIKIIDLKANMEVLKEIDMK